MNRRLPATAICQAKREGMRGVVLKNHFEPTASMAYLTRKEVPGIEVFGGIVLNRSVGGINPVAVERMALVKGGWGRVVWMPTVDSEEQLRSSHKTGPFVAFPGMASCFRRCCR